MKPKALLLTMGLAELGTGAALLLAPGFMVALLLGQPDDSAVGAVIARVAGSALVAIGLTCCLEGARERTGDSTALLVGLLTYHLAVAAALMHGRIAERVGGVGLWPTVAAHLAFALGTIRCLMRPS